MKYLLIVFNVLVFFNISNGQAYYQKIFGDSLITEKGQLIHQTVDRTIYFIGHAFKGVNNTAEVTMHKMKDDVVIIW